MVTLTDYFLYELELNKKEREEMAKNKSKKKSKVSIVMHEFKQGKLHSGSKKGPEVTNPKQAVAIALSEARKSGEQIKKKKKRK